MIQVIRRRYRSPAAEVDVLLPDLCGGAVGPAFPLKGDAGVTAQAAPQRRAYTGGH